MPFKEPFQKTLRAQWLGQQMRELRGVFDGQERARLLQLADDAWRTNEWDVDFADAIYDSTFVDYTWLESRASQICIYNPVIVHGLLQTRDYAEAVIRLTEGANAPAEKVARWVELRMERQRVLERRRTRLAVVFDDVVLRRAIGGEQVLREQLRHLVALVRKPNIEILILPASANLHARLNGAFVLFKMPEPYPEIAYLENLAGRLYLESPPSKRFVVAYDRLRDAALSPSESAKLIAHVPEELS